MAAAHDAARGGHLTILNSNYTAYRRVLQNGPDAPRRRPPRNTTRNPTGETPRRLVYILMPLRIRAIKHTVPVLMQSRVTQKNVPGRSRRKP